MTGVSGQPTTIRQKTAGEMWPSMYGPDGRILPQYDTRPR
jgi:hypothetical protein